MSVATSAYISKNGLVFIFFTTGNPPVVTNVLTVPSNPSFYLNGSGTALANVQGPFWTNTGHTCPWVCYQLGTSGAPYTPLDTDTLTFSASSGWATVTTGGTVPASTLQSVANYVGQLEPSAGYFSGVGPGSSSTLQVPGFGDTTRTLQLAMEMGYAGEMAARFCAFFPFQNWAKRIQWGNVVTADSDYNPLTISAASTLNPVDVTVTQAIDVRNGWPMATGVWTFVADETAPSTPMSVSITASGGVSITAGTPTSGTMVGGVAKGKTWPYTITYTSNPPTNLLVDITITVESYRNTYPGGSATVDVDELEPRAALGERRGAGDALQRECAGRRRQHHCAAHDGERALALRLPLERRRDGQRRHLGGHGPEPAPQRDRFVVVAVPAGGLPDDLRRTVLEPDGHAECLL